LFCFRSLQIYTIYLWSSLFCFSPSKICSYWN